MPNLAAGASASITLGADDRLVVTGGTGNAVLGPGPQAGTIFPLNGNSEVGPFARSQVVYVTATTALVYKIEPNAFDGVVPVTTEQIAAPEAWMLSIANRLITFVGPDNTRYRSDATESAAGTALVAFGGGTTDIAGMTTAASAGTAGELAAFRAAAGTLKHWGDTANEAGMLALGAGTNDTVWRTDTATYWRCTSGPGADIGDWRELQTARAPTTITGSNALTRASHFNRQVKIADAGNTTQTLNNDATNGAQAGDVLEIDNTGAGTVTVAAGTGTLLVATGYTASIAPNVSGSFIYMGSNTWLSATPSPSASASTMTALAMTTPVAVPAATNNVKSTTFTVPAGSMGTKGAIHVVFSAAKTGAVELVAWSIRIGAVSFSWGSGTVVGNNNSGTAVGTFVAEAWIYANGSDQLTVLAAPPGGNAAFTTNNPVAQVSLSLNHGTTDFEIAIGGNGGATTATWIVTNATAVVHKPA